MLSRRLTWGMEYLGYIEAVKQEVLRLNPSSLLEVGCGDGRVLRELAPLLRVRHGCDLSASAIAYAKAFDPEASYYAKPAGDLNTGTYGMVIAIETLEHIPLDYSQEFLKTIWSLVAPGGTLLLTVPSNARPVHRKHYQHFSIESLQSQLQQAIGTQTASLLEICSESRILSLCQMCLMNKRWHIEFPKLNRLLWRRYLRIHLRPAKSRGTHVLAIVTRPSGSP